MKLKLSITESEPEPDSGGIGYPQLRIGNGNKKARRGRKLKLSFWRLGRKKGERFSRADERGRKGRGESTFSQFTKTRTSSPGAGGTGFQSS